MPIRSSRRLGWPASGLVLLLAGCPAPDNRLPLEAAAAALREPPARRLVDDGRQLVDQFQCLVCHEGHHGRGNPRGNLGPTLVRLHDRSYLAGEVPNTPARLAQWIAAPQSLVPGSAMPALGASPAQAAAIAAYLLHAAPS